VVQLRGVLEARELVRRLVAEQQEPGVHELAAHDGELGFGCVQLPGSAV